jgi:Zn-dependent alcohol dehydrogenase
MRIRWTTRIATAAGLLTLIAGIATGGGAAHAAARPAAASAVATISSVTIGLSWTHRGA